MEAMIAMIWMVLWSAIAIIESRYWSERIFEILVGIAATMSTIIFMVTPTTYHHPREILAKLVLIFLGVCVAVFYFRGKNKWSQPLT